MKQQTAKLKRKYVTLKRCQARCDDGKIRFFSAGKIAFFAAEPPKSCFMLAEDAYSASVDFNVVPEEVLLDEEVIPLADISGYILNRFGDDYTGFSRRETVSALVSLRNAPPELLSASDSTVPTAAEFKGGPSSENEVGLAVEFASEETLPEDDVTLEDIAESSTTVEAVGGEDDEDELGDLLS